MALILKVEQNEAAHWDQEQATAMLVALEGGPIPYRTMVYLLLYTGLRKGELMGLEWQDVLAGVFCRSSEPANIFPVRGLLQKIPKTRSLSGPSNCPSSVVNKLKIFCLSRWNNARAALRAVFSTLEKYRFEPSFPHLRCASRAPQVFAKWTALVDANLFVSPSYKARMNRVCMRALVVFFAGNISFISMVIL